MLVSIGIILTTILLQMTCDSEAESLVDWDEATSNENRFSALPITDHTEVSVEYIMFNLSKVLLVYVERLEQRHGAADLGNEWRRLGERLGNPKLPEDPNCELSQGRLHRIRR